MNSSLRVFAIFSIFVIAPIALLCGVLAFDEYYRLKNSYSTQQTSIPDIETLNRINTNALNEQKTHKEQQALNNVGYCQYNFNATLNEMTEVSKEGKNKVILFNKVCIDEGYFFNKRPTDKCSVYTSKIYDDEISVNCSSFNELQLSKLIAKGYKVENYTSVPHVNEGAYVIKW